MTTSRAVRGTKARIFVYICAVLIITGIIACYNNTLSQLEELRKSKDQCRQQQEKLANQLQVIFNSKQKLESSLKAEKAEHEQAKTKFENDLSKEISKNNKIVEENTLQLSALKQDNAFLKTQLEDFKKSKLEAETKLTKKIDDLEKKLKLAENEVQHLKVDKNNFEKQLIKFNNTSDLNKLKIENENLRKEINQLKSQSNQVETRNKATSNKYDRNINNDQIGAPQEQIEENNGSQQVLPVPNRNSDKSSTKSSPIKEPSAANLNDAIPIHGPTMSSSSTKSSLNWHKNNLPLPYAQQLPDGVVPIPHEENKPLNVAENLPERYRNNIEIDTLKKDQKDNVNNISNRLNNGKDDDRAIELFDIPSHDKINDDPSFGMDDNNNDNNNIPDNKPDLNHIMKINPNIREDGGENNDAAMEEDEDDEGEDYDNLPHPKEPPAVRH